METNDSKTSAFKGSWLILISLVINACALRSAFYVSNNMNAGVNPGASPPWYFIIEHLVEGYFALAGMMATLALGFYFRKKYPTYAWMAVLMSACWYSGKVWTGSVILVKTAHAFDTVRRTSGWTDFHSFISDPLIAWGPTLLLGIIAICTAVTVTFLRRRRSA